MCLMVKWNISQTEGYDGSDKPVIWKQHLIWKAHFEQKVACREDDTI